MNCQFSFCLHPGLIRLIAIVLWLLTGPALAGELGPQNTAPQIDSYHRIYRVAPNGSDSAGDGSQTKPLASVHAALAKIADASAEKRYAILVAAGTYGGETVEMKPHVDLFGGFEPGSWERDPLTHRSILDGENTRRPVVGADHARLDGFVIRNGRSTGPGGGILCQRTSPTIANCVIVDNTAIEPADYIYGMFHQVGNDGGGIACIDGANPLITHNVIARNKTHIGGGGGIGARNMSLPIIEYNIICDNRTGLKDNDPDVKKRARSSNGAGISLSHASSGPHRARIAHNLISGNTVGGNSDAGGIYCEYDSSPEIVNNYILNNTCEDDGAGIYTMKLSDPFITGNIFAGNKGSSAIRLSKEGRGHIHNNLFFANHAITCVDAWMVCTNNTMIDGSVAYINRHTLSMKPPVFINNLLWGQGSSVISVEASDPPQLQNNSMRSGAGEANLDLDPGFVLDGAKGAVQSIEYDDETVQSRIRLAQPTADTKQWVGRAVRVGQQWSVISVAKESELVAWGDLRGQGANEVEIAPTYRLSADSPCAGKGVKIPEPLLGVQPPKEASPETMANVGATISLFASESAAKQSAASSR